MTALRIAAFVERTSAEGPGVRACLWCQGCSIRCPGCFNANMWPQHGGRRIAAGALGDRIAGLTGIEGVTILGGEPFDQALGVAVLAQRVRAAGLSVMTFTGYTYEQLRSCADPGAQALLGATDLLVDGPYEFRRPERQRPWVGSTNQRFWFLTDRYAHMRDELMQVPNRVELRLRPDGHVWVNGMASASTLRTLRREITT